MKNFTIRPLSPAIGAEISGLSLAEPLDRATWEKLYETFLTAHVLVFRDQELTAEDFIAFAKRFGAIGVYPFLKGMPAHPEITEVTKEAADKANFGGVWHTDTSYLEKPPKASLLYAQETPAVGGDTLFANMHRALEALSPRLRTILSALTGVNRSDKAEAAVTRADRLKTDAAAPDAKPVYEARHPAIRTHPETGRQSLYLHLGHTVGFAELTAAESKPILDFLFDHQARPEFQCRLSWRPGTLAIWDNRCTLHNALNDYHGQRRHMWRITIEGDAPA